MAITSEDLIAQRPYAFHTTTQVNFEAIRHWRRLRSAAELLTGTASEHLLGSRRITSQPVTVEGVPVEIRDQRPLQEGHIQFEPGFTFQDLLSELNRRVFFWPGTAVRPVKRGTAHLKRYAAQGEIVVLRCSLRELISVNGSDRVYVAACNSGAPRSNPISGHAPRGPSTFSLLHDAHFKASGVQELSFVGHAQLPAGTEWSANFENLWQPLWPAG